MSWECSTCAGRQFILLLFYFNSYFCAFGSLPFAFCLRLCHLLPAATAAAAAWHSDCWNWTKNFACATVAFSLLRAGVATTLTLTPTVTTTPTPTTTTTTTHEKLAALAVVRVRVCYSGSCVVQAFMCVCVCVSSSALWDAKFKFFFCCLFYFCAVPLCWPWLLRNKGYIGFV